MKSRLVVSVVLAVMLWMVALPVAAQEPEQDCFDKGGHWLADEQRCEVFFSVEVRIDYPLELTTVSPVIENAVDSILEKERAAFLEPISDPDFVNYSPGPLALDIQYETVGFSEDYVSLNFVIYTFSGGAHGMTYFEAFTFDLANDVELALDDIFQPGVAYLDEIAPMAIAALTEQLGDMADAEWIAQGAGPLPENYQDWLLTPDALVFIFEPYQVAAYAAGPQRVTILLAELQDILAPQFAPVMAQ